MHLLVLLIMIGIQYSECTFYSFAGMRESVNCMWYVSILLG